MPNHQPKQIDPFEKCPLPWHIDPNFTYGAVTPECREVFEVIHPDTTEDEDDAIAAEIVHRVNSWQAMYDALVHIRTIYGDGYEVDNIARIALSAADRSKLGEVEG